MGKSAILKKIHNAAKNYQRYLAGKTFMYVYEGKSIEVVFKNSSFLHLTGVNTKLRAKEFYKHAKTKNGLKVQEFFFDKNHPYDLAEKKTDHLEDLYRITNMEVLITEDVVSCAVTTMHQHEESLNWLDMKYQYEIDIPFALESEKRTIPDELLTIDDVANMLAAVEFLTEHGEEDRAKSILERWMGMKTPKTIFSLFAKEEKSRLDDVLKTWGKYARMFQVAPEKIDYVGEEEKRSAAEFYRGWLGQAEQCYGINEIEYTLENLSYSYVTDLEKQL